MWFDVKAALAEIDAAPIATLATTATQPAQVAEVAIVATPPTPKSESRVAEVADVATRPTPSDTERYLAQLHQKGPSTYGAAASALGWGATRAGQAEARLCADGQVRIGKDGRADLAKGRSISTALLENVRQGVCRSEHQK